MPLSAPRLTHSPQTQSLGTVGRADRKHTRKMKSMPWRDKPAGKKRKHEHRAQKTQAETGEVRTHIDVTG